MAVKGITSLITMTPSLHRSRSRRSAATHCNNASDATLNASQTLPVEISEGVKKLKPISDFSYTKTIHANITARYPKRHRRLKEPKNMYAEDGPVTAEFMKVSRTSVGAGTRNCEVSALTERYKILGSEFFQCDALELAPKLLGKLLRRDDVILQITEVEAYRQNDTACHGRFGITARTAPVFGPGGHAYVYLCYGLHIMLNVVADKEGVGAAVLIRSCAPVSGTTEFTGLETIQRRRGQTTDKPILLTGPGKVGQALGLTTEWSNHPLYTCGGLEVLDGPAPDKILVGPRIGIEYASPEDVQALWRFAIGGSAWISAPRNTLRPA